MDELRTVTKLEKMLPFRYSQDDGVNNYLISPCLQTKQHKESILVALVILFYFIFIIQSRWGHHSECIVYPLARCHWHNSTRASPIMPSTVVL